eukprot:356209-Chlamydomonas_euryale.AAC.10
MEANAVGETPASQSCSLSNTMASIDIRWRREVDVPALPPAGLSTPPHPALPPAGLSTPPHPALSPAGLSTPPHPAQPPLLPTQPNTTMHQTSVTSTHPRTRPASLRVPAPSVQLLERPVVHRARARAAGRSAQRLQRGRDVRRPHARRADVPLEGARRVQLPYGRAGGKGRGGYRGVVWEGMGGITGGRVGGQRGREREGRMGMLNPLAALWVKGKDEWQQERVG